jgi:hypothetical protein
MPFTAPNIDIQGNLVIDTGDGAVNLNNVFCTGSISQSSGSTGDIQALQLNTTSILESAKNDGSIDATLVVKQNKGIFKNDVEIQTDPVLPEGLTTSVVRDSASQITITITGEATNHQAKDSLNNVRIIIAKDCIEGADSDLSSPPFAINFHDNTIPNNQDTVFGKDVTVKGGVPVTITSSGNAANQIWFAPIGTTSFTEGDTMTKAGNETTTTIAAPANEGFYKLYVIEPGGNVSRPSLATLTVDDTAPDIVAEEGTFQYKPEATDTKKVEFLVEANEAGTAYYVVTNSAVEPTPEQVMNGKDDAGANALNSGNASITANTKKSFITAALPEHNTTYYVHIVVKDIAGNLAKTTITVTTPVKKEVTKITINAQPNLEYVAGQKLNLTGLVVTLTYNYGPDKEVSSAQFSANKITTNPDTSVALTENDHHDKPVVITCDEKNLKLPI